MRKVRDQLGNIEDLAPSLALKWVVLLGKGLGFRV